MDNRQIFENFFKWEFSNGEGHAPCDYSLVKKVKNNKEEPIEIIDFLRKTLLNNKYTNKIESIGDRCYLRYNKLFFIISLNNKNNGFDIKFINDNIVNDIFTICFSKYIFKEDEYDSIVSLSKNNYILKWELPLIKHINKGQYLWDNFANGLNNFNKDIEKYIDFLIDK